MSVEQNLQSNLGNKIEIKTSNIELSEPIVDQKSNDKNENDNENANENANENDADNDEEDYDIALSFHSINYYTVLRAVVFGLFCGTIIAVCIGEVAAIWYTACITMFITAVYLEVTMDKEETKIPGELAKDIYDTIEKPRDTEFSMRCDFLNRHGKPRGNTEVYVLNNAPGALNVRRHYIDRYYLYKGFEVGAGLVSFLFFIILIIIICFYTYEIIILAIFGPYLGCIIGGGIEISLRRHKYLVPLSLSFTELISIPFISIGDVRTVSIGFNTRSNYFYHRNILFILIIHWYRILNFIYMVIIKLIKLIPKFIISNYFATLWTLTSIALVFLLWAHNFQTSQALIGTYIALWVAFVFNVLLVVCLWFKPTRILKWELPNFIKYIGETYHKNIFIGAMISMVFFLIAAIIATQNTSLFNLINQKSRITNEHYQTITCSDKIHGITIGHNTYHDTDMCDNNAYRGRVTLIVILCLLWIGLFYALIKFSQSNKNKKSPTKANRPDYRNSVLGDYKVNRQSYAIVTIYSRIFSDPRNIFKRWFESQNPHLPLDIELSKPEAIRLHEYLVQKLAYYQSVNEEQLLQNLLSLEYRKLA